MSLPRVSFEGEIVGEKGVQLDVARTGKPWARWRTKCVDSIRDANGAWTQSDPTFIDCVTFGAQAEHLAASAARGDRVIVNGRLEQREYEGKDGQPRTAYSVVAEEVGVALRFADAKSARVERTSEPAAADPWATGSA